ncbi:putative cytochrome P450 [Lentzea sp. NBRC 105346]|uniref:cytochrome P450 n=1 Tax=Lentzea sp. NBRC 105346 TaxID=3032205 RepID=UPI0024A52C53|nr:cytochrome P450 [Lentzea sp. NBRC 105346]GLZ32398.1 putative cytochrome P450 [Lentzea sp. NBRC 105346]
MRALAPEVDLGDPGSFEHGVPHKFFTRLRREDPLHWQPEAGGPGFWVVSRHADVVAVSKDWQSYSNSRGGIEIIDSPPDELAMLRMLMLYMDPDEHTTYRKLVARAFTPRVLRTMQDKIDRIARETVDEVIGRDTCDFVPDIAAKLPLPVIADMLGMPSEDRAKLVTWSNKILGWSDPQYVDQRSDATAAAMEMIQYSTELAARKRVEPGDDLTSRLVEVEVDGHKLTDLQFGLFFLMLSIAGNEPIRNLISQAMLAFFRFPAQWHLLREVPSLMETAVEEMMRWATPTMQFRRTATRDLALHGKVIQEGDKVTTWFVSANRDEDVFADPSGFDITRAQNPHLAFGGGGPHYCVGAHMARLQAAAMFRELTTRLPGIRLDGEVAHLRSNFANGIKHLPVRLHG